ncbi:MAG: phosphoribosylformylglycinamidine synthase [Bacteroidales bacterium]
MIIFFRIKETTVLAVDSLSSLSTETLNKLIWLFSESDAELNNQAYLIIDDVTHSQATAIEGTFIGPRKEMITPWSTSAVEITKNMKIEGITRIEEYFDITGQDTDHDNMLQRIYEGLNQEIFKVDKKPEPIVYITNFEEYNKKEGLALSAPEIEYLQNLSKKLGRPLTDSEVFGFSQVNSEHCRHKIFNGTFIINGKEMKSSLFQMIKRTSKENPNRIVSAYKDNCAFLKGPKIKMFHPKTSTTSDYFTFQKEKTVISLKAETHNFPTTVEPFNGAATGTGGEIRDRMGGGKGSFPIAGTAVYMTSYPRFKDADREWENIAPRNWLYQSPQEILIKASNGASDFGNKFGQPIITGSLLTFEQNENKQYGYDKVIMQAGGIGYAKEKDSIKDIPDENDAVVLLGGDNYRIGMGGGAVSSVATGEYNNSIELNAIQRSNPEMQKRAYNAIRALAEQKNNPIISVHDHGAGGHLNCLAELVEEKGGNIDISKLPIGDPTLSAKEIIGNESQERMGLVMKKADAQELKLIAERERAPFYLIGETTGKMNFTLKNEKTGETPIDLALNDMLGSTPKTVLTDEDPAGGFDNHGGFSPIENDVNEMAEWEIKEHIEHVLQLESVACKDWLTNKVDRSVTGLIACQQCAGEIQLPLNDVGVTAIGYDNKEGIATSLGHAPIVGLIDPAKGSRMTIAEALTNLVWAPIKDELKGVSLSANWMWPSRNPGENARLYKAVKGASDFAIGLGINIPTGKDSMSMTQKYPNGEKVISPGTLIVSAEGEVTDISNIIHPVLQDNPESFILYFPFTNSEKYPLGGSAFAQTINKIGNDAPDVEDPIYFHKCFDILQKIAFQTKPSDSNNKSIILAGHDVSSGGLLTTLLEMCFARNNVGMDIDLSLINDDNILFSEMPGVVIQVSRNDIITFDKSFKNIKCYQLGTINNERMLNITRHSGEKVKLDIENMRDKWYKTSNLFERLQVPTKIAEERLRNYKNQPLEYTFPNGFKGLYASIHNTEKSDTNVRRKYNAAIIREKGSNGDREMAWAFYLAGFNVKDVHVTDLTSGRETLDDINVIAFVGGFSNADTLGSAKGWAGVLLYNEKARETINRFYERKDTLSLGICNGCQLMCELGLITPENRSIAPKMKLNDSKKLESEFVGVSILESPSVWLKSLEGTKLGVWCAHAEGKFSFPRPLNEYHSAVKYNYGDYPANPNGSPESIAAISSADGRHLAMMPHPERSLRPWNWAYYPDGHAKEEFTPWIELFINARIWLQENK